MARLACVSQSPQKLRIRGYAPESCFAQGRKMRVEARVNGRRAGAWTLRRPGLFVLEAGVPRAPEYQIEILAGPAWRQPPDNRLLTVNISLIRLVEQN